MLKEAVFIKKSLVGIIFFVLLIGSVYRLFLTSEGNFIFNMDNARDMVDVREMVTLKSLRLTGPTSGIEGVYDGPAWYYLLAIPFILSQGNPYASIIMEIILWLIGGIFLLKLSFRFGPLPTIISGLLWITSPPIVLANMYGFNPNPVLFLTPVLIFFLEKLLVTNKTIYSVISWLMVGLFTNFELNFAIFLPLIIILSIIFSHKTILFRKKGFWIGVFFYLVNFLPQFIFDVRHQFLMTHSLIHYLVYSDKTGQSFSLSVKTSSIVSTFFSVLSATFLNQVLLTKFLIALFIIVSAILIRKKRFPSDPVIIISILYLVVPFLGYIILPTILNLWHLGGIIAAAILLLLFLLAQLQNYGRLVKYLYLLLSGLIILSALGQASHSIENKFVSSGDPSNFNNEFRAVNYVYQQSGGKNFKVYSYLPSVIDYPYQYLFWWIGSTKYGYTPTDYAYLPDQPPYIANKNRLNSGKNPPSSNKIFLIEEPDAIGLRVGWENHFS